jgi:hypothetical protein
MEKIQVFLVLEILGRPQQHVKEALNTLVIKMGTEKGVKILSKTYHDPVPVDGSKDLFTAFAEVGLELDSLSNYFGVIFAYMPSNVEIVKPEELIITKSELNELANTLAQRLHQYDAITKQTMAERDILVKKLYEHAPHLFTNPEVNQNTINNQTSSKVKKDKPTKSKKKTNK